MGHESNTTGATGHPSAVVKGWLDVPQVSGVSESEQVGRVREQK